ncbi:unnamed protein product [Boreogadus saida]
MARQNSNTNCAIRGINRVGAAVPAFLRTPTVIQPHLDMKPFLQFSMETAPPQHSMGLFHNFNTEIVTTISRNREGGVGEGEEMAERVGPDEQGAPEIRDRRREHTDRRGFP